MNTSVSLASTADLAESIRRAHNVELDAYVLRNPLIVYSLESAARAGAHVTVHLGDPGRAPERDANAAVMRALNAAGARVTPEPRFGRDALHAKVAIVDDATYFDDRNFTREQSETLICDRREPAVREHLRRKDQVLAGEAKMLREGAGHDVILATESLGPGPVVDALIERARLGDSVRVMYNRETQNPVTALAVARLRAAGVQIRLSAENHKISVSGDDAWIGSANASPGAGEQHEWGMQVPEPLARPLRETLEYCWGTAKPSVDAPHSPVYRDTGA